MGSTISTSIYRIWYIGKNGKWESHLIEASSENEFKSQLSSFKTTIGDPERIIQIEIFVLDSKISEW